MDVQPYLCFEGRCEEAIEFYRKALQAQVEFMMRFKDSPEPEHCPGGVKISGEKIMHARLRIGESVLMASDGMCAGSPAFKGIALSINVASEDEAKRLFNALADGGQVQMPLQKTFWAECFGMVADRFALNWMVNVEKKP